MYPVITVLDMNLMRNDIRKRPARISHIPVQTKILGSTNRALCVSSPLLDTICNWRKTPRRSTAVAFVGPSVMNLPPPTIPPINAATPDASSPKCSGKPAISAYAIPCGIANKATLSPAFVSRKKY